MKVHSNFLLAAPYRACIRSRSSVIANLALPRQRFLGKLLDLTPAGITLRRIDLDAFEDWINHIAAEEESGVQATTTFFPLHRVEKMILDERLGEIPSLSSAFLTKVGTPIEEYLENRE
jgi:hypothetical protein